MYKESKSKREKDLMKAQHNIQSKKEEIKLSFSRII
jgi:hypothetical protein